MRLSTQLIVATVLAAAWLVPADRAHAQTRSPSPGMSQPSPGMSQPSANIPDKKLDQVAAAIQNVANLKQNYQQQMASAPPSDQQRIADEANSAIVKAVNDQGLSVDEYTNILQVAQNDPDVHQKLLQRLHPAGGTNTR
jgi:hypothetical protein